jgi:hypothetical protein
MESVEIVQEDTESGMWAVLHNGRKVYGSSDLGALVNWIRHYSNFKDWPTIDLYIAPRAFS